ncbi:MAG: hypothetical protein ACRKGH_04800 [Dehalogenimonas sp.]
MTAISSSGKKSAVTIVLAVSLALALIGAGLLAFAWQNNTQTIDDLNADVAALNTKVGTMEQDNLQLQAQNTQLQSQINEIENLYPPKNFASRDALLEWLSEVMPEIPAGNSLQRHLALQKMALADGYTWSIWVDVSNPELTYVGSHVVAGDTIYLVDTTNGAILALHTSPYFLEE